MKALLTAFILLAALCAPQAGAQTPASYAIYAEFARGSNVLMKPNLNRRVFNVTEAQSGTDIRLEQDGSITLQPGTYRIEGFSLVTMQARFSPPTLASNKNYPGYGLVYPVALESAPPGELLPGAISIGTPSTAADTTPSLFDAIYTTGVPVRIAVGHQSGDDLNNEVYLSVYEVEGIPSDYHVFARIAITRL